MLISIFVVILLFSAYTAPIALKVKLDAKSSKLSEIPKEFVGFTADWWTYDDKDYGKSFGNASVNTVDLDNKNFIDAVSRLSPSYWRIGGTPEDAVVYNIGDPIECPRDHDGPWPGPICLDMNRFDKICNFANKVKTLIIFGLNGLYGRNQTQDPMNFTNIEYFLKYVSSKKDCPLYALSLGNELGNSKDPKYWDVTPESLANDVIKLRNLVNKLWTDKANRPLLFAPDGNPTIFWAPFIELAGKYLDGMSLHSYTCNALSKGCFEKLLSPSGQDKLRDWVNTGFDIIKNSSFSTLPIYSTEVGPASSGGYDQVSNRFGDFIFYLNTIGWMANSGHRMFTRSTLVGGYYELLNHTTFEPNPSYFAALLWKEAMGYTTLPIDINSDFVHGYATCSKEEKKVSVLLINFSQNNSISVNINLKTGENFTYTKLWLVRGGGNDPINSDTAEIRVAYPTDTWKELIIGDIPYVNLSSPTFTMPPFTYAFVEMNSSIEFEGCVDKSKNKGMNYVILGVGIGIGVLVAVVILFYFCRKPREEDHTIQTEYQSI